MKLRREDFIGVDAEGCGKCDDCCRVVGCDTCGPCAEHDVHHAYIDLVAARDTGNPPGRVLTDRLVCEDGAWLMLSFGNLTGASGDTLRAHLDRDGDIVAYGELWSALVIEFHGAETHPRLPQPEHHHREG